MKEEKDQCQIKAIASLERPALHNAKQPLPPSSHPLLFSPSASSLSIKPPAPPPSPSKLVLPHSLSHRALFPPG